MKRQYHVLNRSEHKLREIDIDGHKIKLSKQGQTYVTDTGLGEELDARMGRNARSSDAGQVLVIPVDDHDPTREDGHQYSFSAPDLSRFKGWAEQHTI